MTVADDSVAAVAAAVAAVDVVAAVAAVAAVDEVVDHWRNLQIYNCWKLP